jgi:hypothetical protein
LSDFRPRVADTLIETAKLRKGFVDRVPLLNQFDAGLAQVGVVPGSAKEAKCPNWAGKFWCTKRKFMANPTSQ